MGNDEFDFIEGSPGTYFNGFDMYGNPIWGASVDQWKSYYAAQSTVQYYFTDANGNVVSDQQTLAAIQLGIAAAASYCGGTDVGSVMDCIQQVYDTIGPSVDFEGGHYDFSFGNVQINGDFVNPDELGCFMSRCGLFNSLDYSHGDGTFHVDMANVWFFPFGTLVHLGADYIGGNTWWSGGVPPFPF